MSNPFATPSQAKATAPSATPVHGFPLPPDGRQYRPTYSGGRYALPDPATGAPSKFTRVTTGAKTLDDTSGLDTWKTGNVVLGLKDNPELLESLDLFAEPADVRRQVRDIANKAQDAAGAREAAELGEAIHAWTEAVERDGLAVDDVPPEFQPYVRAYVDALQDAGVSTVPGMVERIVYNSETGWVGTLDRMYELADGTVVIGDVKTSKVLRYGILAFSVQLAAYADADYILSADGSKWEPMPPVSNAFAVIAHVPSNRPGHCELVTVDLEAGRYALGLAQAVHEVRSGAQRAILGHWDLPAPSLESKVRAATTAEELGALWTAHADVWTDELTAIGYARLESLASGNADN